MENIRELLRNLIYGAVGIIATFLVLRFILDLGQVPNDSVITNLINSISDAFIYPFNGLIVLKNPNLELINGDAVASLFIYVVGGYLLSKIFTGFLYDNLDDIVENFVDGFFKLFEFIVGLRILFELFAILPTLRSSAFVDSIFSTSQWTQTLLFRIPFGDGYINLSAIVWFIILVILDVFSGRYLAKVLGGTVVIATATTTVVKNPINKIITRSDASATPAPVVNNAPKEVFLEEPPAKSA